jgi:hypothetical protein
MLKKKWSRGNETTFTPPEEVITFFKSISENNLKDAENALTHAIESLSQLEQDGFIGYQRGLEGIFLSSKEKNRPSYLSEITSSPQSLKKAIKEFSRHTKDKLHASYDRWYFKALFDYTDYLLSLNHHPIEEDKGKEYI